jgi:urea carboxylase
LPAGARAVSSHVPGSVWRVLVQPGQAVQAGDSLLVVESMKTEFTLTAPVAGRVLRLDCREGAAVAAGQTVLVLSEGWMENPA